MHRLIKLPFSAEQKAVIAKETDTNAEFIYAGLLHPFFESDELASLLASVSVI